jgi:NitT/TauT family transport system substrate-binding protein
VATASSQPAGYGSVPLLVRTDLYESGEVTTVADLRGRKVAVNLERSIAEYLLAEALAKVGLTVDDVTLVALPFPDMPAALANGAIDAAILPHPLAAQAVGAKHATVLVAGDLIAENSQLAIISFGPRLLNPDEADVAVRFLAAYLRGIRDLAGDGWQQEENVAILSQYTNVPAPAIRGSVPPYFDPNGAINTESVSLSQAYFLQRGYLEYQSPLSVDQVVLTTLLEQALERLGPAK